MSHSRHITLQHQVLAVLAGGILLTGGQLIYQLHSQGRLAERSTHQLVSDVKDFAALNSLSVNFKNQIQDWKNLLIRGEDPQSNQKYVAGIREKRQKMDADIQLFLTEGGLKPTDAKTLSEFRSEMNRLTEMYLSAAEEYLRADRFDARAADQKLKGKDQKVLESLSALADALHKESVDGGDQVEQSIRSQLRRSEMISVALTFLVLAGAWLLVRRITRQLQAVADGLASGAHELSEVAKKVSAASDSLSSSATEQAAALQETSSALEETSAMVAKNAENARRSNELSSQSKSFVERGKAAVEEMIGSIDSISKGNQEIAQQIAQGNRELTAIIDVIGEIGSKTKVIHDIVFQTKLLSFNASVEAARAGEQGKGFAVVAEEVGGLAEMSGNAAKEISDLLAGSTQRVGEIVNQTQQRVEKLMAASNERIAAGNEIAKRCGRALDEIVQSVTQVVSMVTEISSASAEQSSGIREINQAVTQLDQVAQSNSAASQESSRLAGQLNREVDRLRSLVSNLNALTRGEASLQASAGTVPASSQKVLPFAANARRKEPSQERPKPQAALQSVSQAAAKSTVTQISKAAPQPSSPKPVVSLVKSLPERKSPERKSADAKGKAVAVALDEVPSADHPDFVDV